MVPAIAEDFAASGPLSGVHPPFADDRLRPRRAGSSFADPLRSTRRAAARGQPAGVDDLIGELRITLKARPDVLSRSTHQGLPL
jgi:hypothetical protein